MEEENVVRSEEVEEEYEEKLIPQYINEYIER